MYRTDHPSASIDVFYDASVSNVKETLFTGKGNLFGFVAENTHATAAAYLQLFDKTAANVTLGTTAPDHTFFLPANSTLALLPDYALRYFATGCVYAVTAGRTDALVPSAACTITFYSKS